MAAQLGSLGVGNAQGHQAAGVIKKWLLPYQHSGENQFRWRATRQVPGDQKPSRMQLGGLRAARGEKARAHALAVNAHGIAADRKNISRRSSKLRLG